MSDFEKVRLTVRSRIQNEDAEDEVTEIRADGKLRIGEDGFLLLYREATEAGEVLSEIRRAGDTVTVKRRGAVNCTMTFGKEETAGIYEVPPFRFDMTLRTLSLRDTLAEAGGTLALHYLMTLGGAKKNVSLRIVRDDD